MREATAQRPTGGRSSVERLQGRQTAETVDEDDGKQLISVSLTPGKEREREGDN